MDAVIDELPTQLKTNMVMSPDGCWVWTARADKYGYGRITWHGKAGLLVHRVAYALLVGPIPDGLTIDHMCFNPPCFNPRHLALASVSANSRRQRSAAKEHCKNGHLYDTANTYLRPSGGVRDCRTCIRARVAAYRIRRGVA